MPKKVQIDSVRCKSCELCIRACPQKCLRISEHRNPAGYFHIELTCASDCIGCGACVRTCPEPQCLSLCNASLHVP